MIQQVANPDLHHECRGDPSAANVLAWLGVVAAGILVAGVYPGLSLAVRAAVLGVSVYLVLSVLKHPVFSIFCHPFSPAVVLKGLLLVAFNFNVLYLGASRADISTSTLLLVCVAVLCSVGLFDLFWMIYPYRAQETLGVSENPFDRHTAFMVFIAMYLAGWVWRLYAISHGLLYGTLLGTSLAVTSYSNALAMLGQASAIAYVGMLVFASRPRAVLYLLPLEVVWKWLGASKAGPIYVVLPVLAICYARGMFRVRAKFILLTILATAVFLVSFVVIHEYRSESQRLILSRGVAAYSPIAALRNVHVDRESWSELGDRLAQRLAWAEGFANVVNGSRLWRHARLSESSYMRCVSWIVPRVLWTDKPSVSLGGWYAHNYLGWSLLSRSEGEISIWGEGYLNLGLLGAIIIPCVWLIVIQALYLICVKSGSWGLFLLGSIYITLLNSLAVNIAVSVAAVGQMVLLFSMIYVMMRVLNLGLRHTFAARATARWH